MKILFFIMCIFLTISMLIGCTSDKISGENSKQTIQKESVVDYEDSNDPQLVDNPSDLMPIYQSQMIDMYNENAELLHEVFEFIRADEGILYIQADGYVIYKDKSQKWYDEISPKVKAFCNLDGKDYTNISFNSGEENKAFYLLELYYPKTQTMYTVLYSENEFDSGSFWHTSLGENWYLLETPMT